VLHAGAKAVIEYYRGKFGADDATSNNIILPFFLDDVGCNGSESNLLDCLPHHNCDSYRLDLENAGVQCLRKGIAT
jgi:hypothetical protein